jgi:hypothetical protein
LKSSQKCPVCHKIVEYEKYEDFESHISLCRYELRQEANSVREFGAQKTFALYTCSVCHLQFDFNTQASDKIKAHASFHLNEERKKNALDGDEAQRLERELYLRDPAVQERVKDFDSKYFDERSESVEPESVERAKRVPSSLATKPVITPKQRHTTWVVESPRLRFPKLSSSQRVFLFVVIVVSLVIVIANVVSYVVK